MQNSMYYTNNGLTPLSSYQSGGVVSLKEAKRLLERHAPKGEHLAYINDEEARYLKDKGGSGIMTVSGIRSYGFLRRITRPIAKVLDKIVPNEIKPALPFIAAALPFLGAAGFLGSGLSGLTGIQSALLGAGSNAISQLSQEGAADRGINPLSLGLSALGGYLTAPGSGVPGPEGLSTADKLAGSKIIGNIGTDSITASQAITGIDASGIPITASGAPAPIPTSTDLSFLQKAQNLGTGALESASRFSTPTLDQDLFTMQTAKQLAGPMTGAAAETAARKADDLQREYDKQAEDLKAQGKQITENRVNFIRRNMILSGYKDDEINDVLRRSGLAIGGRVGYKDGTNKEGIKTIPINLDAIAMNLFGQRLDDLTYSQKETVYNEYNDRKDKKANGGLMNLKGHEMDLRAAGGFVPIGKKERADDVPARLSKNEFVFTAKAVRGLGKGNAKEGAKKMYQLMRQYEAMA